MKTETKTKYHKLVKSMSKINLRVDEKCCLNFNLLKYLEKLLLTEVLIESN